MKIINHQHQIMKKENLKPKIIRAAMGERASKGALLGIKQQNINSLNFISKSCSCYSSLSPQTSSNTQ